MLRKETGSGSFLVARDGDYVRITTDKSFVGIFQYMTYSGHSQSPN